MLLDTGLHQGFGLSSVTPQAELRWLAVLSQPDATMGLETLWQVCSSLQRLGYPVVVLDGTARETGDAPGLEQLLASPDWQGGSLSRGASTSTSLAVVPAAYGLLCLAERASRGEVAVMQRLQPIFRAYSLVVVYAQHPLMAPLLRGTPALPLVMTSPDAPGVEQSYRQLKHMTVHAGVQCTVASVVAPGPSEPRRTQTARGALETLQRCAAEHLGHTPRTTIVRAGSPQDVQRLALQLLENACTMDHGMPALPTNRLTAEPPAHFVRSH
ncbi:hypothetical protein [Acidovorax sp. FG27]|uniref:hypothetical protein n=1 Tax=Acidovorax sp. FG27 TaxID=3133652 RepID=UPI0030E84A28